MSGFFFSKKVKDKNQPELTFYFKDGAAGKWNKMFSLFFNCLAIY